MTKTKCTLKSISERDMDVLFAQLFSTDQGFVGMFTKKFSDSPDSYDVLNVTLSEADVNLGESDITVVLESNGKKTGVLVEDKIDAIAQPDQCARYFQRGEKGVGKGEYDSFEVFIVCPEKYHFVNTEAKKYPYVVTYEDIRDYLLSREDSLSKVWVQQLEQAIKKAKSPSQTVINEKAVQFFENYREYIEKNAPKLDIRTKAGSNGYWAQYGTELGNNVSIVHKIQEGEVNLYFSNAADHMNEIEQLADWMDQCGIHGISICRAGKSGVLHLSVPKMKMEESFKKVPKEVLDQCVDALTKFTKVTKAFALARNLAKLR